VHQAVCQSMWLLAAPGHSAHTHTHTHTFSSSSQQLQQHWLLPGKGQDRQGRSVYSRPAEVHRYSAIHWATELHHPHWRWAQADDDCCAACCGCCLATSWCQVVSAICWVPNRKGMVACACTDPASQTERLATMGRLAPAYILVRGEVSAGWALRQPWQRQ
jgi:hypothetical protein